MSGVKSYMQQRQIDVKRRNLISVCRYAIKTLIDQASLSNVDDNCEELINFCAVLEDVLSFRLRAARTWYGSGEPRAFWDYIQRSCTKVPNNCIQSIATLENIKSPVAKGRAWIRCALMEKRLSEYISTALQQTNITRQSYQDGAVMLSDEMTTLCGELLGLNAIDFSFCLKGESLDFPSPVQIDYTPYMKFKQSPESIESDHAELNSQDNGNHGNSFHGDGENISLHDDHWQHKYKDIEGKFKLANEQKGYLEELVRKREYQIQETNKQRVTALNTLKQWQVDHKQERQQLESVILELQQQLAETTKQREYFEGKYQGLMERIQGSQMAMEDISGLSQHPGSDMEDKLSFSSSEGIGPSRKAYMPLGPTRKHLYREDTPSMVAMAGSFTSQGSDQSSSVIGPDKGQSSPSSNQSTGVSDGPANQPRQQNQKYEEESPNLIVSGDAGSSNEVSDNQNDEHDIEILEESKETVLAVQSKDHSKEEVKSDEADGKDFKSLIHSKDEITSTHKENVEKPPIQREDEKTEIKTDTVDNSDVKAPTKEEKHMSSSSEENDFELLPSNVASEEDIQTISSINDSVESLGSDPPRHGEGDMSSPDTSQIMDTGAEKDVQ